MKALIYAAGSQVSAVPLSERHTRIDIHGKDGAVVVRLMIQDGEYILLTATSTLAEVKRGPLLQLA